MSLPSGLSEDDIARWREDLRQRLERVHSHPEQGGLGFIEEHVRQATLELQRTVVEKAMQARADAVEANCPCCHTPLIDKKYRVPKSIDSYCGKARLLRTHGWCKPCQQWVFPADQVLGLRDDSTASPLVQEMSALLVAKMPAEQAEALSLRVTGRTLSRSTLAREAQRQGDRAQEVRQQQITQPLVAAPKDASGPKVTAGLDQPPKPTTLVLQIDTWNIRERDHWGQTEQIRKKNGELNRWHWVYTATCFRLEHRHRKGKRKPRAIITERSYVATRLGVEALTQQLHYEAMRRGLAQAERVLVIADGAVWIWNLADERFATAIQRLDLFHANAYLWAVANEIHGAGTVEARRWVKPLLKQVRHDQVAQVITTLEELQPRLTEAGAKAASKTVEYYRHNQKRMKYKEADQRREPVGSGAIESTCRQMQCRMKRCGQFWSTCGDEALMCLDMFWRNERWELLFPHAALTAVSIN